MNKDLGHRTPYLPEPPVPVPDPPMHFVPDQYNQYFVTLSAVSSSLSSLRICKVFERYLYSP
jgi:hypothetical protein